MCRGKMDCYNDCPSLADHNRWVDEGEQLPLWEEEWAALMNELRDEGDCE